VKNISFISLSLCRQVTLFFALFANFGYLLILFRKRGAKSHTGSGVARVEWTHVFVWALVERFDGRFDVALLKSTPSRRYDFPPPAPSNLFNN
jgi:hypothetical protein